MLAAAGVPLYIHLPRYATVEMGLSLTTLGAVLLGIRIMDFAQDPLLGRLVDRPGVSLKVWAGMGAAGLALGFWGLFGMSAVGNPVVWLVAVLVVIFTSYSLLTILFYAQGVRLMARGGASGHYRLAGARELGTVAGILLATVLPTALGYRGFAGIYVGLAVLASWAMWRVWSREGAPVDTGERIGAVLKVRRVRFLLVLAMVNALPVAITSTLFLFFVEDRLELTGLAGPFLLLFFACAGVSAPVWSRAARTWGAKPVLLVGMALAIASFVGVAGLQPGAATGFAAVCIGSGLALGADMVLLPALFSVALDEEKIQGGTGFGLWSLAGKLSLAVAAALVLPLLERAGFRPGEVNAPEAISALVLAYAVAPCILKTVAGALVLALPGEARGG